MVIILVADFVLGLSGVGVFGIDVIKSIFSLMMDSLFVLAFLAAALVGLGVNYAITAFKKVQQMALIEDEISMHKMEWINERRRENALSDRKYRADLSGYANDNDIDLDAMLNE